MTEEQKYKLTLSGGPVSITEMEISNDVAAKIMRLVMPLSSEPAPGTPQGATAVFADNGEELSVTAKQFMAEKQPKSDMERLTCLAYYLTHNKQVITFKTVELTHLNVEAAQPKLSNASATARNAVDQQYLALAGGGKKQITQRGEALVNALPDRNAVKEALTQHPLHGKKRKTATKKSTTKSTKK